RPTTPPPARPRQSSRSSRAFSRWRRAGSTCGSRSPSACARLTSRCWWGTPVGSGRSRAGRPPSRSVSPSQTRWTSGALAFDPVPRPPAVEWGVMAGHLADLYRHRALIGTLVLRELRARYRGSFLGFLWSFLNPLLLMLVYALVFSIYLRVPMDGYAVFLFSGLLPWLWFSSSLGHAAGVIVGSGALVKRVLFPAEILPLVSVLSNLINMLLSLPLLFAFLLAFGIRPHAVLLFLPLLVLLQLLLTTGLALA